MEINGIFNSELQTYVSESKAVRPEPCLDSAGSAVISGMVKMVCLLAVITHLIKRRYFALLPH